MCLPIDSLDYANLNLYYWFSSILARVMTTLKLDQFVRAGLFTAFTFLTADNCMVCLKVMHEGHGHVTIIELRKPQGPGNGLVIGEIEWSFNNA